MPAKSALKNLAKGREVLADKVAIQKENNTLDTLSGHLAQSVTIIKNLEERLLEKDKTASSLEARVSLFAREATILKASVSNWKLKYSSVYQDLCMHRQAAKRGLTKQDALEEQVDILKLNHRKSTSDSEKAVSTLLKMNEHLQSELSTCMSSMVNQVGYWKSELSSTGCKIGETKRELRKLRKSYTKAVHGKNKTTASAKDYKEKSVFQLKRKGIFTEETRNLVRLLVKAGCSYRYINDVIHGVLKTAGFQTVGKITRTSVSRIISEGYAAAQIQLGYEMKKAQSMTFSADGTGHRNINYNS